MNFVVVPAQNFFSLHGELGRTGLPALDCDPTSILGYRYSLECGALRQAAALWAVAHRLRARLTSAKFAKLQQCLAELPRDSSAGTIFMLFTNPWPNQSQEDQTQALPMLEKLQGCCLLDS